MNTKLKYRGRGWMLMYGSSTIQFVLKAGLSGYGFTNRKYSVLKCNSNSVMNTKKYRFDNSTTGIYVKA